MTPKYELQELIEAAEPLRQWLRKNGCPHSLVQVTQCNVELFQGEMSSGILLHDEPKLVVPEDLKAA